MRERKRRTLKGMRVPSREINNRVKWAREQPVTGEREIFTLCAFLVLETFNRSPPGQITLFMAAIYNAMHYAYFRVFMASCLVLFR